MSKRSNERRITQGARTLKFLRQQAKLSFRAAARVSGMGDGMINHLEHGRAQIHQKHLDQLLKAYGTTQQTYEMFVSGAVTLPQDLRTDCIEIIRGMSPEQLKTVHPVLASLAVRK
ncbi:MAG: helix-turn-helix transcriptional regulator [Bdellovibrionales bacterium]|nr:helix-turn-helix transcriptional regulator [Bdellovibrionales bacterium]